MKIDKQAAQKKTKPPRSSLRAANEKWDRVEYRIKKHRLQERLYPLAKKGVA